MKRVRIRSYSDPYFPAFGLNSVRMRENTDQNNSKYGMFDAVESDDFCNFEKENNKTEILQLSYFHSPFLCYLENLSFFTVFLSR